MILFDRAKGRRETEGVVQRISDRHGRVEPLIEDKLTQHSWPKFLHPYPLSDKYFLVSCKPTPDSLWGIYLVDVFDNLVLLKEEEGHGPARADSTAFDAPSADHSGPNCSG